MRANLRGGAESLHANLRDEVESLDANLRGEVESSSCSLRAVAGNITSEHPLHVHIGSKDRRGIWHTRNEPADRRYRSGKGNLPVLLYLQVVMNKPFVSGGCG